MMKLRKWKEEQKMKDSELARILGISQAHLHKYLYENAIPRRKLMLRIYILTLGAVTANDFYDLNPRILEKALSKKRAMREE